MYNFIHYFTVFVYTGSSLGKCAFNGQQCCNQVIISLVDQGLRSLVESDQLNFTSHLAGVQTAIDNMRNKTSGMIHFCIQV